MTVSQAGIDLIKTFESLALKAYRCPAGVWTIGWGHTRGVRAGMQITEERARELLGEDIAEVERDLPAVVHVDLTQGQWDALVSLGFNLCGGAAGLPAKCPLLLANLNRRRQRPLATEKAGEPAAAPDSPVEMPTASPCVGTLRGRSPVRPLELA